MFCAHLFPAKTARPGACCRLWSEEGWLHISSGGFIPNAAIVKKRLSECVLAIGRIAAESLRCLDIRPLQKGSLYGFSRDDAGSVSMIGDASYKTLGVRVDAVQIPEVVARMEEWIARRDGCRYIAVTGMHGVTEAQHAGEFKTILNSAGL